jgi:hypothetical protein
MNQKKQEEHEPIKYKLKEILLNKFSFLTPIQNDPIGTVVEIPINYSVSPRINFNVESELIVVTMSIQAIKDGANEAIMSIENVFVYNAFDLKKYIVLEDEKINEYKFKNEKDESLLTILIGISLSTMRGIIYEKTSGTLLQNAPLPIMDPSVFVRKKNIA